jgi:type III secretion protein D
MHELRILNGYHRGAMFPLNGQTCVIGTDDEADVVIVDPGIAQRHASITLSPSGWSLETIDGVVHNAQDNHDRDFLHLELDDFARVDHIWLTVTESGSPWREPPVAPTDVVLPEEEYTEPEPAFSLEEVGIDDSVDEHDKPAPVAQVGNVPAVAVRGSRKHRLILIPLSLIAIFSAAAAYAITRHYPSNAEESLSPDERIIALAAPTPDAAGKSGKKLAPEELRAAFRKRLSEIDLLKRFNLQLDDQSWSMQAALEEDDAERFQRMLSKFVRTYDINFPVKVKIGNAESMLPFRIQQVISGNNASIVTDDGRRLYVGDEYRGVMLAAINGGQVSFTGKNNINVRW